MKTEKYQIRWYHKTLDDSVPHILAGHRVTYCELINAEGVYGGEAVCHKNDTYDKDKGRKLSLSRAMADAGLSKCERAEIWENYRQMTKKGRWNNG
jgi:hypothetical protein